LNYLFEVIERQQQIMPGQVLRQLVYHRLACLFTQTKRLPYGRPDKRRLSDRCKGDENDVGEAIAVIQCRLCRQARLANPSRSVSVVAPHLAATGEQWRLPRAHVQ
jgi:hypothetical protein